MTFFWDIVLLAVILAVVVCIAVLARALVELASWLDRREAKGQPRARELAEQRARALLREVMGEQESLQLSERGYVEVQSPHLTGRVYRVHLPRDRTVDVYESGRLVARLCIHPEQRLPESDELLAHKLMIEGNEEEYLRKANVVVGGSSYWLSMPPSLRPAEW